MSLPLLSGREVLRALNKVGYVLDHERGSHMILRSVASPHRRATVPDHREVSRGTLRSIIRAVGLTDADFGALL